MFPCNTVAAEKLPIPLILLLLSLAALLSSKLKSQVLEKSQREPTLMGGHGALRSCRETYPVVILQVRSHCPRVTSSHKKKKKKKKKAGGGGRGETIH